MSNVTELYKTNDIILANIKPGDMIILSKSESNNLWTIGKEYKVLKTCNCIKYYKNHLYCKKCSTNFYGIECIDNFGSLSCLCNCTIGFVNRIPCSFGPLQQ